MLRTIYILSENEDFEVSPSGGKPSYTLDAIFKKINEDGAINLDPDAEKQQQVFVAPGSRGMHQYNNLDDALLMAKGDDNALSFAVLEVKVLSDIEPADLTKKDVLYVSAAYLPSEKKPNGREEFIFESKNNTYKKEYNEAAPYQPLIDMLKQYKRGAGGFFTLKRNNIPQAENLIKKIEAIKKEAPLGNDNVLTLLQMELRRPGINPKGDFSKCIRAMIEYEVVRMGMGKNFEEKVANNDEKVHKVKLSDPAPLPPRLRR